MLNIAETFECSTVPRHKGHSALEFLAMMRLVLLYFGVFSLHNSEAVVYLRPKNDKGPGKI